MGNRNNCLPDISEELSRLLFVIYDEEKGI